MEAYINQSEIVFWFDPERIYAYILLINFERQTSFHLLSCNLMQVA